MQPDHPLTDAALDRELERAFAVDPSPEFAARVRARIADQAQRSWRWNPAWSFAGGPIAAIVIVLIAMQLSNRGQIRSATAPWLAARTIAPITGALIDRDDAVAAQGPRSIDARRAPTPPASSAARGRSADSPMALAADHMADVLLDPRETAALQALINGVRSGRVSLDPVVRASTPTAMDLPPVDAIAIPPITIEPLAPAGAEGVRQ